MSDEAVFFFKKQNKKEQQLRLTQDQYLEGIELGKKQTHWLIFIL